MDMLYVIVSCIIPLLILNNFSQRSQKKFIKRYKQVLNSSEPFYPSEINKKYASRPKQFITDTPKMLLLRTEIFWKNYSDRELNKAAQVIRIYFIVMTLVIVINFFVIGYFIVSR